tara:strand:+ start:5477 stop:5944 length:468 start_codon:yes stop_codon:yes gene_type:complete
MRVCGIDPGVNGAICVLDSQDLTHVALLDLGKASIHNACLWLTYYQVHTVWVENIHGFPGMTAKSNFGMGSGVGKAHAIAEIATHGKKANLVVAQVWQKYIGVTDKGKAIKKQVAEIAQKLYPTAELHGKRGGLLDGRSDALMIAHYGLHNKEKI